MQTLDDVAPCTAEYFPAGHRLQVPQLPKQLGAPWIEWHEEKYPDGQVESQTAPESAEGPAKMSWAPTMRSKPTNEPLTRYKPGPAESDDEVTELFNSSTPANSAMEASKYKPPPSMLAKLLDTCPPRMYIFDPRCRKAPPPRELAELPTTSEFKKETGRRGGGGARLFF